MSSFWSAWIIILTAITIVGMLWLLLATRRMKLNVDPEAEQENTTGHVYDGITEEDNPLPGWWLWMFVLSIVFGVAYLIAFPGLGSFPGLLGWTSAKYHDQQEERLTQRFKASTSEFAGLTVDQLAEDGKALKMGQRLFSNNCAVCHGATGEGSEAFPNLADQHWQWGNSSNDIVMSITNGRRAAMPGWEAAIKSEQMDQLVAYVLSLSADGHSDEGRSDEGHSASVSELAEGEKVYGQFCVACHGVDGGGNPVFGAPALNDNYWLYGGSTGVVLNSIKYGRDGVMPAHKDLLSETKIKLVAAYVLSLSSSSE